MRRAGELLREMQAAGKLAKQGGTGANKHKKQQTSSTVMSAKDTLASLGVTPNESSQWKRIAGVPTTAPHLVFRLTGRAGSPRVPLDFADALIGRPILTATIGVPAVSNAHDQGSASAFRADGLFFFGHTSSLVPTPAAAIFQLRERHATRRVSITGNLSVVLATKTSPG